ncbi:MAG: cobalamin-dependent protein [Desulfarculus sp.]|nr:cobalamin-dependent protein [Desulfarculus sp.]
MAPVKPSRNLPDLVAELMETEVLELVSRRLAQGEDPMPILQECQAGMAMVGERYEKGVYYISGLIMAGEIMVQVGDLLRPSLQHRHHGHQKGRILVGTVEGDIHYIGKNLLKILLECYGFTVLDVGEDIPARVFVEKAREFQPQVVCLSCLLTSSIEAIRNTILALRQMAGELPLLPRFVIGGLVDQKVCQHAQADHWTRDAMDGVRYCQKVLGHAPAA